MNGYPANYNRMEFLYRGNPPTSNGIIGRHYSRPPYPPTQLQHTTNPSAPPPLPTSSPAAAKATSSCHQGSAEAAVTEALLTLSSAGSPPKNSTQSTSTTTKTSTCAGPTPASASSFASPPLPTQPRRPSLTFSAPVQPPVRRVSLCSPTGYGGPPPPPHPQWHGGKYSMVPHPAGNAMMTPQRDLPVAYHHHQNHHARPVVPDDAVPPAKKARTVSPAPAAVVAQAATSSSSAPASETEIMTMVSCICPVCNTPIKGLGENKVDWSQPVQGRQRAKTITSIKKHVKDHHEQEPIWNVIVNSLDVSPTTAAKGGDASAVSRIVTANAFVTQALKKAALDQIPNQAQQLRSFHWTEKMMDQRVGIAKGFIQFGGQEYLRNKECQDEMGNKINPKSLRNLAYSLLQSMYDDLMAAWTQNQSSIEAAMATAPLGLLRNRFQLLFAAPDKWSKSWYMDPSKYSAYGSSSQVRVARTV